MPPSQKLQGNTQIILNFYYRFLSADKLVSPKDIDPIGPPQDPQIFKTGKQNLKIKIFSLKNCELCVIHGLLILQLKSKEIIQHMSIVVDGRLLLKGRL